MASDPEFVEFVGGQMGEAGRMAFRKMFGEYAICCADMVGAPVCDNPLFVRPTPKGRAYLGEAVEAPSYPGAKPYFLVEDRCEDRAWSSALIRISAAGVPAAKPRPKPAATAGRPAPEMPPASGLKNQP